MASEDLSDLEADADFLDEVDICSWGGARNA